MFKKVGTRNTCDQCTKNNEKYAEIKKRYESVVDSMIRLDSGMQDVRDDYESRLIAVKVAKKILEKKLKSVQHEFDRINDELRTVLGLVVCHFSFLITVCATTF